MSYTEKEKILLMAIRQALIIALGGIEDYLCMERSIVPLHKRKLSVFQKETQEEEA